MKLGALDATVHTIIASEYGVQGYPTIKYFSPGVKDSSSISDYTGGRTSSDIVNWALEKLAENVPTPEVKQVFFQHEWNWMAYLHEVLDLCYWKGLYETIVWSLWNVVTVLSIE